MIGEVVGDRRAVLRARVARDQDAGKKERDERDASPGCVCFPAARRSRWLAPAVASTYLMPRASAFFVMTSETVCSSLLGLNWT
jgi:hypothetical protein